MAVTAQMIIMDAYYLSGIASRTLQSVTSQQMFDGLNRLNGILDMLTMSIGLIPLWQEYNGVFVPGQEVYSIDGLVEVETMTFFIPNNSTTGSVRYSMRNASRERYFGTPRAEGINTLPFQWHLERTITGGDLYVYYLPSSDWSFQLWAKFSQTNVTLSQDLSLSYQGYYLDYLRYKLARYLCDYYPIMLQPNVQETLNSYELMIKNVSPLDLTQIKLSQFQTNSSPDYAQENLGHGFFVVGG